jgi:serine/threonine protein kinase
MLAPPATITEFLDVVLKSGVLDQRRLNAHLRSLEEKGELPTVPSQLARRLVNDGLLTAFQAGNFLKGKSRGLLIKKKYRVLEFLGAGGMGNVFLCEQIIMRRLVAVKVVPEDKAKNPSFLERFHREARALATLQHPNIVRAIDVDSEGNQHFLVMEYIDGTGLQMLVHRGGPLAPIRAAHYIAQAAVGLQHAHQAGLVHRDIKPSNLMLDRSGTIKILDLGLARFFHDREDLLTKVYNEDVLGTADYLAPEQALDSHVDIRADIYSLGATFYFCLTGRGPFEGGTAAQKLIWAQTRTPEPIRSLHPEVPPEMVAVVEKMMAKEADRRYQTPREVVEALAPWTAIPIAPPTEAEMPRLSPAVQSMAMPVETTVSRQPPTTPGPVSSPKLRVVSSPSPLPPKG